MNMMTPTPVRKLHPIDEARAMLGGLSRSGFYARVKDGDIALVKIGKRSFVSAAEIERIASGNEKGR